MPVSFLKKGAESAKMAAEAALKKDHKMFRFWLKEKEEARITFVDGHLSPEGWLLPDRYYEHNLKLNGKWNNWFVCPERTNPDLKDVCPICPYDKASLVALFTIIDHREFQSQDKTKKYKDTPKLLVVKTQTFDTLYRRAKKYGGLAGVTFDVARVGDKAASVGSDFEFVEKRDVALLEKLYVYERKDPKTNLMVVETNFRPADYEKEIVYRTGEELSKLGLGNSGGSVSGMSAQEPTPDEGAADYSKEL